MTRDEVAAFMRARAADSRRTGLDPEPYEAAVRFILDDGQAAFQEGFEAGHALALAGD